MNIFRRISTHVLISPSLKKLKSLEFTFVLLFLTDHPDPMFVTLQNSHSTEGERKMGLLGGLPMLF